MISFERKSQAENDKGTEELIFEDLFMKKSNENQNKVDSTKERQVDSITEKLIEGGVFKKLVFDQNGMVFKGQTTDTDRPNGIGRLELENGDFYEGEFHNGMFEGKGRLVQSGGKMYEGAWKCNRREGKGMELWPDGKRYQGKFKEDKKNGYGEVYRLMYCRDFQLA